MTPKSPAEHLRAKFPDFVKSTGVLGDPERGRFLALADLLVDLEGRLHDTGPGRDLQARGLELAAFAMAVAGNGSVEARWQEAQLALREAHVPMSLLMDYVDGVMAGHLRPQLKDWAQFRQHARQTALAPGWMLALALGADQAKLEARRSDLEALAQRWALAEALRRLPEDHARGRTLIPFSEIAERGLAPEELYSKNLSENAKRLYRDLATRATSAPLDPALVDVLFANPETQNFVRNRLRQQDAVFEKAVSKPSELLLAPQKTGWLSRLLRRD